MEIEPYIKVTVILSGDGADELFLLRTFSINCQNHWLWLSLLYKIFVRGLDRLVFDDKFINECVLSSSPGDSHLACIVSKPKIFITG